MTKEESSARLVSMENMLELKWIRRSCLAALPIGWVLVAMACGQTVEIPDVAADGSTNEDASPSADARSPDATTSRDSSDGDSSTGDGGARDGAADASADAAADAAADATSRDSGSTDSGTFDSGIDAGATQLRVFTGGYQTCAIRGRALYCWGANDSGQLQLGTSSADVARPTKVGDYDILDLGLGYDGSCMVRAPGSVYCAGRLYGVTPKLVGTGFIRVSHGRNHACALANDGTVSCWGSNASGQLGRGSFGGPESDVPAQVQGLSNVRAVVAARSHTCALKNDKTVWCWGGNSDGQLGIGLSGSGNDRNVPTQVPGLLEVAILSANAYHTCATKTDRSAWCWGGNQSSQLGVGDALDRTTPTKIPNAFLTDAALAGSTFSLARAGGSVFTFGSNTNSELGRGAIGVSPLPVQILSLDNVSYADVGFSHACVLRQNALLCWGDNNSGQLGLGDMADRNAPVAVPIP